jgi:hypothetical protein
MDIALATLVYADLSTPFTDGAPGPATSKYPVAPPRQMQNETLNRLTFVFEASGADRAYSIAADSTRAAHIMGRTSSINFPTTTGAYPTGEGKSDIPVSARETAARTIPPSGQLYARSSRESLCNGF